MGYLGSYLGGSNSSSLAVPVTTPPTPVVAQTIQGEPTYINHVAAAINRLCAYARGKSGV